MFCEENLIVQNSEEAKIARSDSLQRERETARLLQRDTNDSGEIQKTERGTDIARKDVWVSLSLSLSPDALNDDFCECLAHHRANRSIYREE